VHGIAMIVCRHRNVFNACGVRGGERMSLALFLLSNLIERGFSIRHFIYDFSCKFTKTAINIMNRCPLLFSNTVRTEITRLVNDKKMLIGAFHAYGHGAKCQLLNISRHEGAGLTSGEEAEQVNAMLIPSSASLRTITTFLHGFAGLSHGGDQLRLLHTLSRKNGDYD